MLMQERAAYTNTGAFAPSVAAALLRCLSLIDAETALARLVADACMAAGAAIARVRIAVRADAGCARVETLLALALLVHAVLCRSITDVCARPAMQRVARDVFAAVAAI
jgi:hypothetical protein